LIRVRVAALVRIVVVRVVVRVVIVVLTRGYFNLDSKSSLVFLLVLIRLLLVRLLLVRVLGAVRPAVVGSSVIGSLLALALACVLLNCHFNIKPVHLDSNVILVVVFIRVLGRRVVVVVVVVVAVAAAAAAVVVVDVVVRAIRGRHRRRRVVGLLGIPDHQRRIHPVGGSHGGPCERNKERKNSEIEQHGDLRKEPTVEGIKAKKDGGSAQQEGTTKG